MNIVYYSVILSDIALSIIGASAIPSHSPIERTLCPNCVQLWQEENETTLFTSNLSANQILIETLISFNQFRKKALHHQQQPLVTFRAPTMQPSLKYTFKRPEKVQEVVQVTLTPITPIIPQDTLPKMYPEELTRTEIQTITRKIVRLHKRKKN